jgi:biuret amidohydrolase
MDLIKRNLKKDSGSLDPARTAIIGVHWQNELAEDEGTFGPMFAQRIRQLGMIPRMRTLLDESREAGCTIVFVNVAYSPGYRELVPTNALFRTVFDRGGFLRGTNGTKVVDSLAPQPSDFVLEHSRVSCFYGTELDTILRSMDIDTVVVTGVATNVAVDHTVRDAAQAGYKVILLEDCCCSSNEEFHNAALMTLRLLCTSTMDAEAFLAKLHPAAR